MSEKIVTKRTRWCIMRKGSSYFISERVNNVLLQRRRATCAEARGLFDLLGSAMVCAEAHLGNAGDFSKEGSDWLLISWVITTPLNGQVGD